MVDTGFIDTGGSDRYKVSRRYRYTYYTGMQMDNGWWIMDK